MQSPGVGGEQRVRGRGRKGLPILLALIVALIAAVALPGSAQALAATGHGVGYLASDGVNWIGTYRLADGRLAFCLEAGKASPVGHDYVVSNSSSALGLSKSDLGELAYIARKWSGTNDATTAAAGQLAVWTIAGLHGHPQSWYADRAGAQSAAVVSQANAMLAQAKANATVGGSASLSLRLEADGTGWAKADLTTQLASGGTRPANPSSQSGTMTLTGGVFDDGSTSTTVKNAEYVHVKATGDGVSLTVRASVTFAGLPFDSAVTVGSAGAGTQMLLFTPASTSTATASSTQSELSPLPFQPRVETRTSQTEARAGAAISDSLRLDAAPGDGLMSDWGVYGDSLSSTLPIPVTVRSTLLGPFDAAPTPATEWPADAPTVCSVEVVANTGPGDYRTPECTLPSDGFFVWVETIDPADTPAEKGGGRVRPWKSGFGTATEVTHATTGARVPSIRTTAATGSHDGGAFAPGDCVADGLSVTGLGDDASAPAAEVESLLLGPFDEEPADGHDFGLDDLTSLPVAGSVTTSVSHDGDYTTPCVTVTKTGHYVFVLRSPGSADGDGDGEGAQGAGSDGIPAFSDLVAHTAEALEVAAPDVPVTPVTPETPDQPSTPAKPHRPATPAKPTPAAARVLAYTGAESMAPEALAGAGAIALGLAVLLVLAITRRARRRGADPDAVRASRSERP
ncbi:thioester domain-containing protein [Frondihabitans australicus]|uniref:thioester domain-containing protein n=1 Tax=Frondihabitans australicus TaxID=386892 RepID=UPI0011C45D41|nr:thioester domain-containing protein [Frondihabitans australicus]